MACPRPHAPHDRHRRLARRARSHRHRRHNPRQRISHPLDHRPRRRIRPRRPVTLPPLPLRRSRLAGGLRERRHDQFRRFHRRLLQRLQASRISFRGASPRLLPCSQLHHRGLAPCMGRRGRSRPRSPPPRLPRNCRTVAPPQDPRARAFDDSAFRARWVASPNRDLKVPAAAAHRESASLRGYVQRDQRRGVIVRRHHRQQLRRIGNRISPVFDIGPVSLFNQTEQAMAARGEKASVDAEQCMRWLDTKPPKSVLYVSFGSMGGFAPRQLTELGAGLLASRRPFVWVIKSGKKWPGEVEAWLAERSVDGNPDCLMIKGWAPQVAILSHPAVGGFVTHCGWNSALEGVCGGVPMITWPLFAEQFLNEKLLVEVLGIGVSLGVEKPSEWGKLVEEDEEVAVTRDELAKAVKRLMEGEEAKERRRRAEELRERARKAMEHGGSSYLSMEQLIHHAADRSRLG
ncbi:hypothetical protein Cni_G03529 [Canna indica]|uniref:Glycosyltransferase n=1 Tax=Canna indica TaxID=4628 RepID=A0AAQ3Q3I2_9LILI|nr:hypothetical protein Cni_G03529 [Canna indica]